MATHADTGTLVDGVWGCNQESEDTMLDALALSDLSHGDRLQRELALTFARALHSHNCTSCGMLRVCTVVDCRMRKFPVEEREYVCASCKSPEWAADEPAGGGDE